MGTLSDKRGGQGRSGTVKWVGVVVAVIVALVLAFQLGRATEDVSTFTDPVPEAPTLTPSSAAELEIVASTESGDRSSAEAYVCSDRVWPGVYGMIDATAQGLSTDVTFTTTAAELGMSTPEFTVFSQVTNESLAMLFQEGREATMEHAVNAVIDGCDQAYPTAVQAAPSSEKALTELPPVSDPPALADELSPAAMVTSACEPVRLGAAPPEDVSNCLYALWVAEAPDVPPGVASDIAVAQLFEAVWEPPFGSSATCGPGEHGPTTAQCEITYGLSPFSVQMYLEQDDRWIVQRVGFNGNPPGWSPVD